MLLRYMLIVTEPFLRGNIIATLSCLEKIKVPSASLQLVPNQGEVGRLG
jgi:hypothetical protein